MTRDERGMATAEYTVGTLGAVGIGLILYKLGVLDHDNPWFESFRDVLNRALSWHRVFGIDPSRIPRFW